jgi:hypothetical protein
MNLTNISNWFRALKSSPSARWRATFLALAVLSGVLSQLARISDEGRRFVQQLDDCVFRDASALSPFGLVKNYHAGLLGSAAVRQGEGAIEPELVPMTDADAKLFGYKSAQDARLKIAREREFREALRCPNATGPAALGAYLQGGRHLRAIEFTLCGAFAESPTSLVLTVLALVLAAFVVKDLLQVLNDGCAATDFAWFWGTLLAGPVVASLLMVVLKAILILFLLAFDRLLAASAVPMLAFVVQSARDGAKAIAKRKQRR